MEQQAIIFHKNNADLIADSSDDYSAAELLEEYDWYLERYTNLVLCQDVLDNGFSCISYVVTIDMFERNTQPVSTLNDKTFTHIRTI